MGGRSYQPLIPLFLLGVGLIYWGSSEDSPSQASRQPPVAQTLTEGEVQGSSTVEVRHRNSPGPYIAVAPPRQHGPEAGFGNQGDQAPERKGAWRRIAAEPHSFRTSSVGGPSTAIDCNSCNSRFVVSYHSSCGRCDCRARLTTAHKYNQSTVAAPGGQSPRQGRAECGFATMVCADRTTHAWASVSSPGTWTKVRRGHCGGRSGNARNLGWTAVRRYCLLGRPRLVSSGVFSARAGGIATCGGAPCLQHGDTAAIGRQPAEWPFAHGGGLYWLRRVCERGFWRTRLGAQFRPPDYRLGTGDGQPPGPCSDAAPRCAVAVSEPGTAHALRDVSIYYAGAPQCPVVLHVDDRVHGPLLHRELCVALGLQVSEWHCRRVVEALPSFPPEQYVLSESSMAWQRILVPVDLRLLGGRVSLVAALRSQPWAYAAQEAAEQQHVSLVIEQLCRVGQSWFAPSACVLLLPQGDTLQVWPCERLVRPAFPCRSGSLSPRLSLGDVFSTSLSLSGPAEVAFHQGSGANSVILYPQGLRYAFAPTFADHLAIRSAVMGDFMSGLEGSVEPFSHFARVLPPA